MKKVHILYLALVGTLAACASQPVPVAMFDDARELILTAEQAGAENYAPLELRSAREHYAAIQTAVDGNDNEQATWMAERSIIDSQLAIAKTAAAKARAQSQTQKERNAALRADLGLNTQGEQP